LTVGDVAGVSISIGTAKSLLVVFLGTGEIGSPAQLVSTSVHFIRCQTASRNRASAAPMLQLDHLISGNSATSAWTTSRRGRNSALSTIRRARHVTGSRSRPHGNNDVLLPGFGIVALNAASLIRRKV